MNRKAYLLGTALGVLAPTEGGWTAAVASETITYTYDAHGRLEQVSRSGSVNNGVASRYYYDQSDNRSSYWSGSGSPPAPPAASPPAFSIGDASVTESSVLVFNVTRHGSTNSSFTVNYATANGTASAGSDYTATSGMLTFGPDDYVRTVSVSSILDTTYEPNETFTVNLSSPSGGATIADGQGVGTIVNFNHPPVGVTDYNSSGTCLEEGKVMNVTGNDTDAEGHGITLIGIDSVTGGAGATVENGTSVRFYPGAPTTAVVTYRIQDSYGAQGTGQLRVTVSGSACQ